MHSIVFGLLVAAFALAPALVSAKGGGHSSTTGHSYSAHSYSSPHSSYESHSGSTVISSTSPHSSSSASSFHASRAAVGVTRDAHGHIARSVHAKESFRRTHPCPGTGKTYGPCQGYVIDHVQALKHGGADDPSNMQWQTTAQAKAKDKWE